MAAAALALAAARHGRRAGKEDQPLTWNIPYLEDLFQAWVEEFQKKHPGVDVEWLDKKGPELPTFYQTQLVAGTPPDIINTQGRSGSNTPPTAALHRPDALSRRTRMCKDRFNPDYLANWAYEGKNYMFPFYITKTLLFCNKTMFKEAGLSGPPQTFDEMMAYAAEDGGRREDRPHDPELRLALLAAVRDERHRAADAAT